FGSDPDSTALVLQALAAAGQDPAAPAWAVAGRSPLAWLIAAQDQGGGFAYPGNPAPDPATTSQVPLGLLSQPLPATGVYSRGASLAGEARATLRALLYLERQQRADGSVPGFPGSFAPTELYAISAAAAGYDPNTLRSHGGASVFDYLAAN